MVYGIACIVLILLTGAFAPPTDNSSSATPVPNDGQPTTATTAKPTATPKPTPTPKPQSTYEKYSGADKETIKADALAVDWADLIRNPDNYQSKLIMLKGDLLMSSQDLWDKDLYKYTVVVGHNNYNPAYVEFWFGKGLMDGDKLTMYGVVDGETFTDYPIIKGVYCTYSSKST